MEGAGLKYLLDTAPWINGVTLPDTLPARIRRLMEEGEVKGLCSVSLLEAAILHRLGRLELEGTLPEFFAAGLSADLQLLELTPAIAAKTNDLDFHGDPFDRTIIATAAILNLTLITTDSAIRDAKECMVEFYPFRPSRAKE
jgi:PIN domain nuclease of toxin-antitoxin system